MNSAIGYSEGAEVPEDKTKDRIEKDAAQWSDTADLYYDEKGFETSYIAGATAERNKAIDECIALIGHQHTISYQTWPEVKKKLESLKNKPI